MSNHLFSRRQFLQAGAATGTVLKAGPRFSSRTSVAASTSKPAVLGGSPVRTDPFPEWPVLERIDEEYFLDSLREKKWCRLYGDVVSKFEQEWAASLGVRYATGVVNGTNALYAALNALQVGPGDEVIVPPFTFVATVNAVIQQFALPVFADTDAETFQIDPSSLERVATENTRCVLPVHLGGSVADMDGVLSFARKRGLSVVEDACQAHFAEWDGRRVGGVGDIGCFSFQSTKILPCGEGGAIVTNREDLLDRFHAFQNNGRDRQTGTRRGYQYQGSNLRMTEFQGALLLGQFSRFEQICAHREANAAYLAEMLGDFSGIRPAGVYPKCTRNTYYIVMLRYEAEAFDGLPRDRFLAALRQEGIPVGSGYSPLNKEPLIESTLNSTAYRRIYSETRLRQYRERNECPVNERVCRESVFLGQRALLGTRADTEQIAEAVRKIRAHAGEIARAQLG